MLHNVLSKYEFLFNGTLGTCKTIPLDIKLQPDAKPYHTKPYPASGAQESVFKKEV